MRTVGELLQKRRQALGINLEDVEKATRIRVKYLTAIEADKFALLPSLSYAKGFVKNYSEYLGLNSSDVLAFYRRQTKDSARGEIVPQGMAKPLNQPGLRITPANFLAGSAGLLLSVFVIYFGLQYKKLHDPPGLVVTSPQDKTVTTDNRIDVLGKTDADATVTVNGVTVLVRGDGRFFDQVSLEKGVNQIEITATSRYGKTVTVTRQVGGQGN